MATASRSNYPPSLILSPHQQSLLFAALNSNKSPTADAAIQQTSKDPTTMASISFAESLLQQAPGSGTLSGFVEDSPFIDYDYDFDADAGFDYDFSNDSPAQTIGKLPGSSSDGDADTRDKRSHPADDDNDEDGGGKRREGDDRSSKKPGRKPLASEPTSEPTSKRKAQNRAAQRAFRERKEKHLKDLETKVQDLEKASESANHENSILRAQVERMSIELREYRKRLSLVGNGRSPPLSGALPPYLTGKGSNNNAVNNPNDVNFQFEFPKFGRLPGPPVLNASSLTGSNVTTSPPPVPVHRASSSSSVSPLGQSLQNTTSFGSISSSNNNSTPQETQLFGQPDSTGMADFSGLFASPVLDNVSKEYSFDQSAHHVSNASRSSTESSHGHNSTGQNTSYSSPSASSNVGSNAGLSSSCGTSPEPWTQSPGGFKSNDNVLTTIGEENSVLNTAEGEASFREKLAMACGDATNPIPRTMSESGVKSGNFQTPAFDINGIDWFAQQNGNQFDPQLFGDYREPQNNILTGGLYDDSFFTEAFALPEFTSSSPFVIPASPAAPRKDLVREIDQKLNEEDEVVPGETTQLLTCNNMWEKIQSCPKVQNGDIDMDSLCSQLQSKAKCSGDGPVITEKDFDEIIHKIVKK